MSGTFENHDVKIHSGGSVLESGSDLHKIKKAAFRLVVRNHGMPWRRISSSTVVISTSPASRN